MMISVSLNFAKLARLRSRVAARAASHLRRVDVDQANALGADLSVSPSITMAGGASIIGISATGIQLIRSVIVPVNGCGISKTTVPECELAIGIPSVIAGVKDQSFTCKQARQV